MKAMKGTRDKINSLAYEKYRHIIEKKILQCAALVNTKRDHLLCFTAFIYLFV